MTPSPSVGFGTFSYSASASEHTESIPPTNSAVGGAVSSEQRKSERIAAKTTVASATQSQRKPSETLTVWSQAGDDSRHHVEYTVPTSTDTFSKPTGEIDNC